jgi:hypothetical protein
MEFRGFFFKRQKLPTLAMILFIFWENGYKLEFIYLFIFGILSCCQIQRFLEKIARFLD